MDNQAKLPELKLPQQNEEKQNKAKKYLVINLSQDTSSHRGSSNYN